MGLFGEADDIKQSLFRILNAESAAMNRFGPLSFSVELASAGERKGIQQALVAELEPACLAA